VWCITLWLVVAAVYSSNAASAHKASEAEGADGAVTTEDAALFGLRYDDESAQASSKSLLTLLADFVIGRKETTTAERAVLSQQLRSLECA